MSEQKQYAERDPRELDKLGNYFSRHMLAMTAEDLHYKSDIAAELAWRDAEIDRLRIELSELRAKAEVHRWNIEKDGDDLLVCFNEHEKGEKCNYVRFTSTKAEAQAPSDEELLNFAASEQFLLFCDEDEFLQIAKEVLLVFGGKAAPPA